MDRPAAVAAPRTRTAPALLGRDAEQREVRALLGRVRNGAGGSLLLVGEPGVGKTSLLEDAAGAAGPTVRWLRVDGHGAEATMPYAAVQRLVLPLREHLVELPRRQRDALLVIEGAAEAPAPDLFLVGLGVLGLLAAAAVHGPVVCVVDDAHLLDHESLEVLAFVARRIPVEPIALLLAARDEEQVRARLAGVAAYDMRGLGADAAGDLLARTLGTSVDPAVLALIVGATLGNPLALIDLADHLTPGQLGVLGICREPVPVGARLEQHYVAQVRATAPVVQDWMLVAAADASGSLALIDRAAAALGLPLDAADLAEGTGLVELAENVRFRHPLVQAAVYNAAPAARRRRTHRVLAAAAADLDLVGIEAWHLARATPGTDAGVADRVERAADLAASRGGQASRASLLLSAAELSPPGPARSARLVGAAEAAMSVGAATTASDCLARVDADALDDALRGRIATLRYSLGLFRVDTPVLLGGAVLLVEAADAFHRVAPAREQEALAMAFQAFVIGDRLSQGISREELGRRIARGAAASDGAAATVLRGVAALVLEPYDAAVPQVRAALDALTALPEDRWTSAGACAASLGTFLWDDGWRRDYLDRAADVARERGALQDLDALLWIASLSEVWGGSIRRATASVEGVREVRRAMGYDAENVINAAVMAWTGHARAEVEAIGAAAGALGFGGVETGTIAATATRDLAEGHYADAFDRLGPLVEAPFLHVGATYFADFVEAAVRSGREDAAEPFVLDLEARARANGSAWCRGVAARCRALVSSPEEAEVHHVRAVDELSRTSAEVDLGRAHLLHGEWLRRMRRRREAIEQLGLAADVLERAGATMFLPRVHAELEAAGAAPGTGAGRARSPRRGPELTHQELAIARLAGSHHTNAEIGAQLFISPNTVDYHLRKVFQKLGISSRRQLADRLDLLGG